ncbi:MAG: fibrobacter succinogenes major paralogous domain-containing protein, partial [Campylobacter sp.]|nr:fibrobacter succinogenes major paralogous domain-containing protein [Campylobacter sp.]
KSTCKNGGGNDNKVKNCVKDTVIKALPECNASLEGVIGVDTTGIKVICRENEWQIYVEHGSLTDDRDGQTYKTVTIGAQTWMAQNLNYETENSWCYKDDPANCAKYGRLYTWAAAVGRSEDEFGYGHECGLPSGDVRGICPSGLHLPSYSEWGTLFTAVGGSSKAGTKLKSLTGWNSGNGTDTYSFAALPAGFRYGDGDFGYEGEDADFWSSTEYKYNSDDAYYMNMEYSGASASMGHLNKNNGYSVRCLKDSE